ncbi:hypothetical protein WAB17_06485 [Parerythrobacter aurantius]|uniref:hypothetical protein n=1 Tax=Parerythrobacter aurantius TaxID=3127706 RepID=UPI00325301E9
MTASLRTTILVAITAACAWQAYRFALLPNLRLSQPAVALAQYPDDASALSRDINNRIGKTGKYATTPEDRQAAVRSLVDTPLSRSSLRIIGMDKAMRGSVADARTALGLSNRISRRDSWAQIWLLENAARQDDSEAILNHYNAALAVTPELAPVLNPILVKASSDREVRAALRPYLSRDAAWAPGFLALAAKDGRLDDVMAIARPVTRQLGTDPYKPAVAQILLRLAAAGEWPEAMELARSVWDDFDSAAFADVSPSAASADERLGPLAWQFGDTDGIDATFAAGKTIEALLSPLARGTVATRSVPVTPGQSYQLRHRTQFERGSEGVRISWRADCLDAAGAASAAVWQEAVPVGFGPSVFERGFTAPAGCNLLSLTLSATGPDGQTASVVRITNLEMRPRG